MSAQWRNTSKKPKWGRFTVNPGERLNGIQEVSGSIPLISTITRKYEPCISSGMYLRLKQK